MFVSDAVDDKMTYYLDHDVDVLPTRCDTAGQQEMHVITRLTSHVPDDARLPASVVGQGGAGLRPGDMRLATYLYAPFGGRIDEATLDGRPVQWSQEWIRGIWVGKLTVDVPRGSERVLDYTVTTGRGQTAQPTLLTTPGARSDGMGLVADSACD